MADRWEQAKALFHAALEQDPAGRAAFLDAACADDPALRREVDSLLASHDEAGEFLASPAPLAMSETPGSQTHGVLAAGSRLGPYGVLGLLASGGMGQVYRARDTRLGREVAVKVLPADVVASTERVRRFEQEARAASALNHPNILTLYDVGTHEGAPYLVTELLEGDSLAAILKESPLPMARALEYALQIARGLAAAHDKGIVHRDLKPANLFVTRDDIVKILDFGLARLTRAHQPPEGTTATGPLTRDGVVLGTVGYMAPEQVRGEGTDPRSDIFSFGVVLYEMLSGRRAFARDTAAETMTAILRDDPAPLAELRPEVSPAVIRLLGRCLSKRPEERFASGREALFALEVAATTSGSSPRAAAAERRGPRIPRVSVRVVAALLGAALAGAAALGLLRRNEGFAPEPIVSSLVLPRETGSLLWFAGVPEMELSPDGSRLAYVGAGQDRRSALWIRDLASTAVRELPGTANAAGPFWSPDGRLLGFFAEGKLKKTAADGGPVQVLCDAPEVTRGMSAGTWSRDGVILFTGGVSLSRVSASGGRPQVVLEPSGDDLLLRFPSFLADGRRFLYHARRARGEGRLYAGSLDQKVAPTLVHEGHSRAALAPTGHLVFARDGVLLAQPFDESGLRPLGDPKPITTRLANAPANGRAGFSVSQGGRMAYVAGARLATEIVSRDRQGRVVSTHTEPGRFLGAALAPDGRRLGVEIEDDETNQHAVWVLDLERGVRSRLSPAPHDSHHMAWSPDGREIAFTSTRTGKWLVYRQRTDGLGDAALVYDDPRVRQLFARQWAPDGGAVIAGAMARAERQRDRLWLLPLSAEERPRPLVDGVQGALSPDRRWLAVASMDAGRLQIFVFPYPALDTRWQLSVGGGNWPKWRADGRELFYVSEDRKLMSVPLGPGSTFEAGAPRALFPLSLRALDQSNDYPAEYDVLPRGDRFVICQVPEQAPSASVTLITDWTGLLRRP